MNRETRNIIIEWLLTIVGIAFYLACAFIGWSLWSVFK